MHYLVAYDVFDNRRRRKIQKFLYLNSISYQKSAVEIRDIDKTGVKNIAQNLLELSEEEDVVGMFYFTDVIYLGKNEKVELIVWKKILL